MKRALLVLSILVPAAAGAQTTGEVLERGIAAETGFRWHDALIIYLHALEKEPLQASLWIRVADIQAHLGHLEECVRALTHAAAISPGDASIHVRLAEAYAEAGKPNAALEAIEHALALVPSSVDYLRRRATLAAWVGAYGRAQDSYRRLIRLAPDDDEAMLGLARVSAWSGDTDGAVARYRDYLQAHGEARDVWIELARAEAWRGNFAGSMRVLEQYRERFGESSDYSRERAGVLARGGRPREATRLIDRLLPGAPDDYALNLFRTVALAAQQRREARSSFGAVERLGPDQPETRAARAVVRIALASTGEPRASFYGDSDGLRIRRVDPRLSLALPGGTRVDAGFERADLRAQRGSGLEQIGGGLDAHHQLAWAGVAQPTGPVTLRGRAGYASLGDQGQFAYGVEALLASDTVQITAARESGFVVVSPRTLGLGLTRVAHRLQFGWSPSLRYHVALDGLYEDLSDGNRRWEVLVAPRRSIVRSQRINLDLGLQARQFGATRDLDNGYYDPSRYESYSFTAFPYLKVSDNTGLAGAFALGVQRDDRGRSFGPAGNAAVEATFGIYDGWMLKVNGSLTVNERLQSGAFRGYGGGVVLVRRF